MAKLDCKQVVKLSDHINASDYYVFGGTFGRISAAYKQDGANITEITNHGNVTEIINHGNVTGITSN